METELTKTIKRGLRSFKPEMPTQMRTVRFAEEVWTPTGVVDVIRFEDYIEKDSSYCDLIEFDNLTQKDKTFLLKSSNGCVGRCKIDGETYPNKHCVGCVYHRHVHKIGMLITCFECKITVADFRSKNGHNFCGNHNYYVVPKEIVEQIKPWVPETIGIIQYNKDSETFRTVKPCVFQEVEETLKTRLLYDALKKWVDKFGAHY